MVHLGTAPLPKHASGAKHLETKQRGIWGRIRHSARTKNFRNNFASPKAMVQHSKLTKHIPRPGRHCKVQLLVGTNRRKFDIATDTDTIATETRETQEKLYNDANQQLNMTFEAFKVKENQDNMCKIMLQNFWQGSVAPLLVDAENKDALLDRPPRALQPAAVTPPHVSGCSETWRVARSTGLGVPPHRRGTSRRRC